MRIFALVGLWLSLVGSVVARRRIPCSEAVDAGLLEPDQEDFTNFPCGRYPFDYETGDDLKCWYYPNRGTYECQCHVTTANCWQIRRAAKREYDAGNFLNFPPCTAKGFERLGRIREFWWECEPGESDPVE